VFWSRLRNEPRSVRSFHNGRTLPIISVSATHEGDCLEDCGYQTDGMGKEKARGGGGGPLFIASQSLSMGDKNKASRREAWHRCKGDTPRGGPIRPYGTD